MSSSPVGLTYMAQLQTETGDDNEYHESRRLQNSLYSTFSAKRGSGRIERYFIHMRTRQFAQGIYIVAVCIVMIALSLFIYFLQEMMRDKFIEVKSQIMVSTLYNCLRTTMQLVLEANFFTEINAVFYSYPELIHIGESNDINKIVQLFLRSHKASLLKSIFSHEFGTRSGFSASIEIYNNTFYGGYINATEEELTYRCLWKLDNNGFNSSFPYTNGDCSSHATAAYTRPWFQYAQSLNRSSWTDYYMGDVLNGFSPALVSYSAPSYHQNGSLYGVVATSIEMRGFQNLYKSLMPSGHSRFALLNNENTIITLTGDEESYSIYKNNIVTKTLQEIRDSTWVAIMNVISRNGFSNYTALITIDGQEYEFSIRAYNFTVGHNISWRFISCICIEEIFPTKLQFSHILYILPIIFMFLSFAVVFFFVWAIDYFINNEKNKLLSTSRRISLTHLKETGIYQALIILKKLMRSHADNKIIFQSVKNVADEIENCHHNFYFDSVNFYNAISSKNVIKKFMQFYGSEEDIVFSKSKGKKTKAKHNANIKHQIRHVKDKYNDYYDNINKIQAHDNNSDHKTYEKSYLDDNSDSSFTDFSIHFDLSGIEKIDFEHRKITLHTPISGVKDYIKNLFHRYNESFLIEEEFNHIIDELIEKIGPDLAPLCADSLELNQIILQWRVQEMLSDSDYAYALMLSSLIFQVTARHRSKPNQPLVNRYLLTENTKLNKTADVILIALYQIINENDGEGPLHQRWHKIVKYVRQILDVGTLQRHIRCINRISVMSKSFSFIKRRNKSESLELVRILFIASIISPIFHDSETSTNLRKVIHPEISNSKKSFEAYISCFKNVLIVPLVRCLGEICGTKFLLKFFEK